MFRYTISDEDYLNMGRWIFAERRGSGPKAVAKLLLRTVIQMATVAGLILFMPEAPAWMKWTLGALSLVWALLSLFQYFFLDFRARLLLRQSKNSAEGAEYRKEHRLSAEENGLRLSYGNARLELPYEKLTAIRETETLHIILCGKDIFEAVPKRAVPDEDWEAFRKKALDARDRQGRQALEELRASLEEAPFRTRVRLSRDEMAEKVIKMTRSGFLYGCGWSAGTVFSLLFPLGLAVYSLMGGSWPMFALCMGAFILLNLRFFVLFTPAGKTLMKDRLMAPAEDGYLLAAKDGTAYLLGDASAFSYPLSGLKKTVWAEDGLYVYFAKQGMLYVPSAAADGFLRAAGLKKSIRDRAALGEGPDDEA